MKGMKYEHVKGSNQYREFVTSSKRSFSGDSVVQSQKRLRLPASHTETRDATSMMTSYTETRDGPDSPREKCHRDSTDSFRDSSQSESNAVESAMVLASLSNMKQPHPPPHPPYNTSLQYAPMHGMYHPVYHNQTMYAQNGVHYHHGYPGAYAVQPPVQPPEFFQSQNSDSRTWACDFCNEKKFLTYEEACDHEKTCSFNPNCQTQRSHKTIKTAAPGENYKDQKSYSGVISLHVPIADEEWLSEKDCFIRSKCIEAFSVEDYSLYDRPGGLKRNQVGLRCKFCVNEKHKAISGVSFPVSCNGIYESVKRWSKLHLQICRHIPEEVRDKINRLEKVCTVPKRRKYWSDSAEAIGIGDTQGGLRFIRDVSDPLNKDRATHELCTSQYSQGSNYMKKATKSVWKTNYIVSSEDKDEIPPFLYTLLRQLEPCCFTDADKYISRSRCSVGFNGFQCRHCSGRTGLGKYFPTSPKAFATNSTCQNIFSHLLKCADCPNDVKEEIKTLKANRGLWTRRTTGWRNKFFVELWKRLHDCN